MSNQTAGHREHISTHPAGHAATVGPVALLRILFGYVRPYTARAALLFATLLEEGAFNTALALSLKFLIDYAITPRDARFMFIILGGLCAGFLLTAAAQILRDYLYAWLGARILNDIRQEMFSHFQRLSMGFYARSRTGDLLSRFSSDLAAVENAVVLGIPGALLCVINIVFSTLVLFVIDWRLALGAMAGLPFCVVGPKLLGPRALGAGHRLRGEQAALADIIQENLGAQQIVKAFSLRGSAVEGFARQAERIVSLGTRFNFLSYVTERSPNIGMLLFNVLLISGGSYLAYTGSLSVGSLVSFNALFIMVSSSVMGLTAVTPTLLQATGGIRRVRELLEERPAVVEPPDARPLPRLSEGIRFEHVTFGYGPGETNLADVSMELPAGERIAFVGHSGSGKSTNLNLIMRFYDPQAGRVTFDGVDLRGAALDSLYGQVGVVFQESFLFNLSVRENIRLGKLGATDAEVEEAARAAELHDIGDLDDSYLREVSEMFITERVPAGRTVITEGDEGDRFYIINRGTVAVTAAAEDGTARRLATLDDGDYFGEISLLAEIPATASVTTLTPSVFLILMREQLLKLMLQHPGLAAQVRGALERRMKENEARKLRRARDTSPPVATNGASGAS